jgi:ribonucleoside-diphosphate reductase alpha chain
MWKNRDYYNGLSVLPFSEHSYVQAPFEECTEDRYNELLSSLKEIDLTKVVEESDNTNLTDSVACGGGKCDV